MYLTLKIPNEEVAYIYSNTIKEWFNRQISSVDLSSLYNALLEGDASNTEKLIKGYLKKSISYNDDREVFYHGVMLGLLSAVPDYEIRSNREYGNGRPDIVLIPLDEEQPATIIELKWCKTFPEMKSGCEAALNQIKERNYAEPFLNEGYHVLKYGICFCKKSCKAAVDSSDI